MTTDRTAAPSRGTALADRPASGAGRTPAPPSDTFSALLGAATPKKGDAPVRRDDNPASRRADDHGRADKQRRSDETRRADDKRANHAEDAPAPADTPQPASDAGQDAAEEKPATPPATNLFALQLASPLPPQAPPTGETPATTPPTLPAFAGQVPAATAATAAQATLSGDVAAIAASTAAAAATAADAATATAATVATATPTATTTPGAVALEGLPAEATADATLPAGIDLSKPQAQTPAADAAATTAQDAAPQASATQQNATDAQSQGQPQPQDQDTTPQPTVATAHAAKPADAPAPAPAQPANTSPIAPNAAPAMPSTPSVERAVPLSRAVATTGVMVHMMSSRGVEHARLNLKPAELGGIEVRLRSTSAGLHAMLVADSPEAARMLASAGDDLKRQLEEKNVTLLSLDVSTSDQRQDQPAGFNTDGFGDDRFQPGSGQNARRARADESALLMDTPDAAETTLVLPDGVHVDVLA